LSHDWDSWRDSSLGDVALVDIAGAQQRQRVHHAHDPRQEISVESLGLPADNAG